MNLGSANSDWLATKASEYGAQAQQGEQLRQVDQPLGLLAFVGRERVAFLLLVEQRLQALLHAGGQTEARQIFRTSISRRRVDIAITSCGFNRPHAQPPTVASSHGSHPASRRAFTGAGTIAQASVGNEERRAEGVGEPGLGQAEEVYPAAKEKASSTQTRS